MQQTEYPRTPNAKRLHTFLRLVENNRLQIFWVTLYTLVMFGIFIERAYCESVGFFMVLSMNDFLPGCLFAVVVVKCFMIGANV